MEKVNMKNMKINLKKAITLLAVFGLGFSGFAQEANDGFVVPLDEDFSKVVAAAAETSNDNSNSGTGKSRVQMGTWTEITSDNAFLIRDIAVGDKKGYEFDNSHLKSNMNWWFWGELGSGMQLDAEISVWDFDKTLYQANSYGANVPDVTWGDGFQSFGSFFFAPISESNDDGVGTFNKLSLNFTSPYVNLRVGYGNLKNNGMTAFTGIYTTIDRWDDVGHGYTEIHNGSEIQQFGDFKINAMMALSKMRDVSSQPFGLYDIVDVKYTDKAEIAFTFASATSEEKLFHYNDHNTNAISAYAAVTPFDKLKVEGHYLETFGTDVESGLDTSAIAFRGSWKDDDWSASMMVSFAGRDVNSVWGSDGQKYDDICKGTITAQIDFKKSFDGEKLPFTVGLNQNVTVNDDDYLVTEGISEKMSFRTQPYCDFDFTNILGKDLSMGFYTVLEFNTIAESVNEDNPFLVKFDECGFEFVTSDIPFTKKVVIDYAIKTTFNLNDDNSKYESDYFYNSLMVNADLNDRWNVHLGTLFNSKRDSTDSFIPFGLACGFTVKNVPLPGHPFLWMHFTYAMNPYEDNNYTLYRADDARNRSLHRTYLLNTLDTENASRVAMGLVWSL